MSLFRRLAALLAVSAVFAVFAASCHQKDEIAMTVGDVSIRGAMYQAYLIQADSEAKSKLSSEASNTSSQISDYRKESVEGKSYDKWVKDRALELCKRHAAVETLFKKYNLSLSEEEIGEIDSMINLYESYGYLSTYTNNGVSVNTYKEVMKISYKSNKIFEYYYDEGGTQAVSEKDKKETLEKLYVLAQTIEIPLTTYDEDGKSKTLTTAEQDEAKKLLESYAERLKKGESFEKIKAEYDKKSESDKDKDKDTSSSGSSSAGSSSSGSSSAASSTASSDTSSQKDETPKPKDETAQVYGSEDSGSPSDYYKDLKALKVGEVLVKKYDEGFLLAVRKDILGDPYYMTAYKSEVLNFLKGEEYEKHLNEEADKLKVETVDFVVDYYTPKKIKSAY